MLICHGGRTNDQIKFKAIINSCLFAFKDCISSLLPKPECHNRRDKVKQVHCGGSKAHAVDSCERLVGDLKQDDLGQSVEVRGHGGHQHVGGHAVEAEVDDAEQDLL